MHKHQGSALPIVLVMMLILTILGIAGLRMTQAQFRMAGAEQFFVVAMQAAESAIATHLVSATLNDAPLGTVTSGDPIDITDQVSSSRQHTFMGDGPVPGGGYSMANSKFAAFHFEIEAKGVAPANSSVDVAQGVYLIAHGDN